MKIKLNTLLITACLLMVCNLSLMAQQTPKKTTKKPATTKTKKKVAAKPGKVYICDGTGGYTYHSRQTCVELKKCKGRVLDMTKQEAIGSWGRKQCKNCY